MDPPVIRLFLVTPNRLFLVTPNLAHQPNPKRCMWKLANSSGVVIKVQKVNAEELTRVVIRATAKPSAIFVASLRHQTKHGWQVEEIKDESDSRRTLYFDDAFISFEDGEVAETPAEFDRGAGSSGRHTHTPHVNEVDNLSTASSSTLLSEVENAKRLIRDYNAVARAAQVEAKRERQNAADAEGRAAAAARRATLAEEGKAIAERRAAEEEAAKLAAEKKVAELQALLQQLQLRQ